MIRRTVLLALAAAGLACGRGSGAIHIGAVLAQTGQNSAGGQEEQTTVYAAPEGALRSPGGASPLWVNIGGVEPGDCGGTPCLFRWFWDTGASPNAVVSVTGTQTNLSDGSNGTPHVQNAIDKWHGVAGSDVHLSGISASAGNVSVILDAPSSQDGGASWTTPLGCGGGILGLGGPGPSSGPRTFKGDTSYFAPKTATVSMPSRRSASTAWLSAMPAPGACTAVSPRRWCGPEFMSAISACCLAPRSSIQYRHRRPQCPRRRNGPACPTWQG